uniref:Uncharacterized protein n=1 Tax=viral metagenome TaxID=1070528 RepID=A0A6H1Z9M5_9ZZZZ
MLEEDGKFVIVTTEHNEGIRVDDYEGVYALTAIRKDKKGKTFPQWAHQTRWSVEKRRYEIQEKPMTICVKLGRDPVKALKLLLVYFEKIM